jgi:hypothetical protein
LGYAIVPKNSIMKRKLEAKKAYNNAKTTSLEPK